MIIFSLLANVYLKTRTRDVPHHLTNRKDWPNRDVIPNISPSELQRQNLIYPVSAFFPYHEWPYHDHIEGSPDNGDSLCDSWKTNSYNAYYPDFSNIVWQSQSSVQPDVPYIQTLSPELPTFHILSPVLPCINFKFNNFRFKIPAPQTNAFAIINRN